MELEDGCTDASRGKRPRGLKSAIATAEKKAAAAWAEPLLELPETDVPPQEVELLEPGIRASGNRPSLCGAGRAGSSSDGGSSETPNPMLLLAAASSALASARTSASIC